MKTCKKCGKPLGSYTTTAYGEDRCELCFEDYLMTDRGKVEYLLGLTTGELDIKDYDADFLGHVAVCWMKYRSDLNMTLQGIRETEEKAKQLGIL